MKTIGLIGGMSWESSIEYYRIINQGIRAELGGVHSAQSVMVSVDFGEIEKLQGDFAEDYSDYSWEVETSSTEVEGLFRVAVTVQRSGAAPGRGVRIEELLFAQ